VGSGSQAEDKDPRIGIAKSGHGLSPVLAIAISATALASDPFAIFHEARTAGASNNFGIEFRQPLAVD
jgi:hypothetical protein